MCDYSLQSLQSRPAVVGDRLITINFGTGSRGLCSPDDRNVAVCLLPGTELAFDMEITEHNGLYGQLPSAHKTAVFRQFNKEIKEVHHDYIELPDGHLIAVTLLCEGQTVTVLQMPAEPKNVVPDDIWRQGIVFAG